MPQGERCPARQCTVARCPDLAEKRCRVLMPLSSSGPLSGEQGVQLSQAGKKALLALPGDLICWDPKAADGSPGLLVTVAELLLPISRKNSLVSPAISP